MPSTVQPQDHPEPSWSISGCGSHAEILPQPTHCADSLSLTFCTSFQAIGLCMKNCKESIETVKVFDFPWEGFLNKFILFGHQRSFLWFDRQKLILMRHRPPVPDDADERYEFTFVEKGILPTNSVRPPAAFDEESGRVVIVDMNQLVLLDFALRYQ